jgi:glycolate oxidase FAD binding subunit
VKPKSENELAECVRDAKTPFEIIGTGTKRAIGYQLEGTLLDLSSFDEILAYEPEELILDVGAGAKLADIEKLLTKNNQYFAFEPPDYSKLLGSKHSGTIGGMVACNLSGPRRLKAGAMRDHILGLTAVSGRGEIFKAGARVVKNVTGYDVPKLMSGSYGTLAAFTSVIIKTLPKPEAEETLLITGLNDMEAVQTMSKAMQSSAEVSAAAHVPNEGTYFRLEGIQPSIDYRRDKLFKLLDGKIEILKSESNQVWKDVRDVSMFAGNQTNDVWRISVAPSEAPQVIANLKIQKRYFFDWAGGLIWLEVPQGTEGALIRSAFTSGHATLIRSTNKSAQTIFHPQAPELAALSARVKNSFDPRNIFNPGRMVKSRDGVASNHSSPSTGEDSLRSRQEG